MANFKNAWIKTSKLEAGYINHSKDNGKETYRGISIASNPSWEGWDIVHSTLSRLGINDTLDISISLRNQIDIALNSHPQLNTMVESFYKINYWNPFNLDNEPDQLIAEQLFDTAVLMGVETTRLFIKKIKEKEDV